MLVNCEHGKGAKLGDGGKGSNATSNERLKAYENVEQHNDEGPGESGAKKEKPEKDEREECSACGTRRKNPEVRRLC